MDGSLEAKFQALGCSLALLPGGDHSQEAFPNDLPDVEMPTYAQPGPWDRQALTIYKSVCELMN